MCYRVIARKIWLGRTVREHGGLLASSKGWCWIFWVVRTIDVAFTDPPTAFTRKTYSPYILKQKCRRLQNKTGNMHCLRLPIYPLHELHRRLPKPLPLVVFYCRTPSLISISALLGLFVIGVMSDRMFKAKLKPTVNDPEGLKKAESRLPPMHNTAGFIPAELFLYRRIAEYKVYGIVPLIAIVLMGLDFDEIRSVYENASED
ncbi:MAG: hypothetical protein Q9217_003380 [Psora testacea]